ncbi:MAG: hypothetical protein WCE94_02790 [Candidatus Methanoperedens sp.]
MPKKKKCADSRSSKVPLHTTVSSHAYNKILDFGKGFLNTGIENVIDIVEKKQYVVKHELEQIANHILNELSKNRRNEMKTLEDLRNEYDLAQRIVLEKTIELTLFNQGIDTEKVPMRDFDRLRRISMQIDKINEKTNDEITKIKDEAQTEINDLISQLETISLEIKAKQVESEKPGEKEAPEAAGQEAVLADGNSQTGDKPV